MLKFRKSFAALAALAAVAACGRTETDRDVRTTSAGGSSVSAAGNEASGRGMTLVRFVNVLPVALHADLVSDQRPVFENVPYKNVTEYAELRENVTKLQLRLAGNDSAVAENRELVTDGQHYTVIAWPDEHGKPQLKVVRDELVPDSGKARVRFIQTVPDLAETDLAVQGASEPIFSGVNAGHEAGFKNIEPTRSPLVIRRDAQSGPLLTLSRLPLEANHAYTIVLTRNPQSRLEAVTFEDHLTGPRHP